MQLTPDSIREVLRAHLPELQEKYRVRSIGLFGSYARGDATEDSDIDILVDFDPSIGLKFVHLAEYLEELLGRRVDLVSTRAVSPRLRQSIEEDLLLVKA
ncbi:MAG: nucleotidyltransferase family protein [bacterium]|nr:nucleotidyltransferase family protein [bacterium]